MPIAFGREPRTFSSKVADLSNGTRNSIVHKSYQPGYCRLRSAKGRPTPPNKRLRCKELRDDEGIEQKKE